MDPKWKGCVALIVILQISASSALSTTTTYPPLFIEQPAQQVVFENGNAVRLPCVADGEPQPR